MQELLEDPKLPGIHGINEYFAWPDSRRDILKQKVLSAAQLASTAFGQGDPANLDAARERFASSALSALESAEPSSDFQLACCSFQLTTAAATSAAEISLNWTGRPSPSMN